MSTIPPKYPAITPSAVPTKKTIKINAKVINIEYLEPYIILENKSLPRLSVPKIYCLDGRRKLGAIILKGFLGAMTGAKIAIRTTIIANVKNTAS